jgi:Kef-type K+ transport system membrane component KefB
VGIDVGELDFIRTIGIMIVSGAALLLVARLVRMPSIVAFILAGLALGPVFGVLDFEGAGPDDIESAMDIVSVLGIALLLFIVGLEMSFDKIREVGRVSIIAGLVQIGFIGAVGMILSVVLGFGVLESAFIAAALTNSSTVLVVKLMDQKREMHLPYGQIIVALNLVKDVALIVVLTVVIGLAGADTFVFGEAAWALGSTIAGALALMIGAVVAGKYILPAPFRWAARSPQSLFVWSLTWCFLFVVAAEWLGLSAAIGAFLGGISLAQLPVANDLRRRVHPLMSFFLAMFFVAVGAQMRVGEAMSLWLSFTVFCLFILLVVPVFTMWVVAKLGYGERTSFLAGSAMGQISELSFVFAAIGWAAGIIERPELSMITLLGLVTISISSYVIIYNQPLYEFTRRRGWLRFLHARSEMPEQATVRLSGHVVVVGMNPMGRQIAFSLHRRGEVVLAIDTDPHKLADLPCLTMVGNVDYESVLEEAGVSRAKAAITALQIEDANNLFVYRCKRLGIPVAAHAFDRSVRGDLQRLNPDFLIDPKTASAIALRDQLKDVGVAIETHPPEDAADHAAGVGAAGAGSASGKEDASPA